MALRIFNGLVLLPIVVLVLVLTYAQAARIRELEQKLALVDKLRGEESKELEELRRREPFYIYKPSNCVAEKLRVSAVVDPNDVVSERRGKVLYRCDLESVTWPR